MPDTSQSPSSAHARITANMANLANPHDSPMISNRSQRVKTVYLSGPIKILLPLDECEEVGSSGREQPELDADMPLPSASVGAKNEKIVYLSGPIRIIVPWDDSDEFDSTKLASQNFRRRSSHQGRHPQVLPSNSLLLHGHSFC